MLEQVNLRQTITEYYPPQLPDPVLDTELLPSAHNPSAHPRSDGPAVKRVIYTEITTQTETQTTCDSIAKRNVLQGEKSELAEKVVEKPPSSVMAVKWIAIGIGLLALLIIVIKIRIK